MDRVKGIYHSQKDIIVVVSETFKITSKDFNLRIITENNLAKEKDLAKAKVILNKSLLKKIKNG